MKIIITIVVIILTGGLMLAAGLRYLGYFINHQTMGKRLNTSSAEYAQDMCQYKGLREKRHCFVSEGNMLAGDFYFYDNISFKGIIVVVHGHHLFHRDYLSEIEYFAKKGYLVYAYDSTGSGESQGACPGGQTQWTLDLNNCLHMLEALEELHGYSIYLFGHSTGAYAVCAVMNFFHERVKGVIACAPINSGYEFGRVFWKMYPHPSFITKQTYLAMKKYEKDHFGKYSEYTALTGINNTDIPILIVQCRDDKVVMLEASMVQYETDFTNANVKIMLLEHGGHWAFRNNKTLNKGHMDMFYNEIFTE